MLAWRHKSYIESLLQLKETIAPCCVQKKKKTTKICTWLSIRLQYFSTDAAAYFVWISSYVCSVNLHVQCPTLKRIFAAFSIDYFDLFLESAKKYKAITMQKHRVFSVFTTLLGICVFSCAIFLYFGPSLKSHPAFVK